jgi:predicted regulator of Ras-like GTPase activity (Roadblock/LC7/MglB family)
MRRPAVETPYWSGSTTLPRGSWAHATDKASTLGRPTAIDDRNFINSQTKDLIVRSTSQIRKKSMAMDLAPLRKLSGFIGGCLVDSESGMLMAKEGGSNNFDLEVAAAANTEVVRAKRRAMEELELDDHIEDILITLGNQFHIIRLLPSNDAFFLYSAVDRNQGNLALARVSMKNVAEKIKI